MHLGRKIEKIRELRNMKQETLASKIGVSQQTISRLEQSENIEDEKLKLIADALEVPADVIKAFNEDALMNNINTHHTFHDNSSLHNNLYCTFDPIEKIIALAEENKKLYERIIQEKDHTIELYRKQQDAS